MPRVPTYDNFEVAPRPLPGAFQESNVTPGSLGRPADTLAQLGRGAQNFGDAMFAINREQQAEQKRLKDEADQVRVDDALNQAKERVLDLTFNKDTGYTTQRGRSVFERESKQILSDEFIGVLDKDVSKIVSGLANDDQRRKFQMRYNDLRTSFYGDLRRHESQQSREYTASVDEGMVRNARNTIGLFYDKPDKIDEAVSSINAAVARSGRLAGRSAEWIEAEQRKQTSDAHKLAIGAALEKNNTRYAEAYLQRYKGQMDADDILRVQSVLTKETNASVALGAVENVMRDFRPAIQPTDGDRAWNILKGTESNNRHVDDKGRVVLSPVGAVGIAQVMPGTGPEAAKLAGLPWDKDRLYNDPKYNEALGRAYFAEQLRTFGRLDLAYAAYNAGPGAVQNALAKAKRAGEKEFGDVVSKSGFANNDYRAYLPKETQDYVTKNMREYNAGGGAPARATLQDVHTALRNDPALAGNPDRLRLAVDESTRRFNESQAAIKQRENEAGVAAMRWLSENNGRFSALPAHLRAPLTPDIEDKVRAHAKRVAEGDDTTDPSVYQRLASNPQFLKGLSAEQFDLFQGQLSRADFKHFANERAKLLGGRAGVDAENINTSAVNSTLNNRMRMMGIDPTPKDSDKDANMRVGAIRKYVNDSVMAAQRAKGSPLSEVEINSHIDSLMLKTGKFSGFFSDSSGPMLNMRIGDLPSATVRKLREDFKRRGIDNPTDADILGAHWRGLDMQRAMQPAGGRGATGRY